MIKIGKSATAKVSIFSIAFVILLSAIPFAAAQNAPYSYGAAGEWTQGDAIVGNTEIFLDTGRFWMFGNAMGQNGYVSYADSWGYMGGNEFTASKTGYIHAYTNVYYFGKVAQSASVVWMGGSETHIWIWQTISIIDVTNGANWVTVSSRTDYAYNIGFRNFGSLSETIDKTLQSSVDANCVVGHKYRVQVNVEMQSAAQIALFGVAVAGYNFGDPYYSQINNIDWYII